MDYVSELKDFAGSWIPDNFVRCGQAVSRTQYSELFARIGTTWGVGDGSTTFDLPPNGRAYIGPDTSDTSIDEVGKVFGTKVSSMPGHTHGAGTLAVSPNPHTHPYNGPSGTASVQAGANVINIGNTAQTTTGTSLTIGGATDSQGAAGTNMPPSAVVTKAICWRANDVENRAVQDVTV